MATNQEVYHDGGKSELQGSIAQLASAKNVCCIVHVVVTARALWRCIWQALAWHLVALLGG